jgi:hypothetical protein
LYFKAKFYGPWPNFGGIDLRKSIADFGGILELWNFIIGSISFIAHCCYSYQSFSDFNGGQFCISYSDFCLYGLIRVLFLCGYLSIHLGRAWQLFWRILE